MHDFLPSSYGYAGVRSGYEYKRGGYGLGYYATSDSDVNDNGALSVYRCSGCGVSGLDVHRQQAIADTAQKHKFYYTHRKVLTMYLPWGRVGRRA